MVLNKDNWEKAKESAETTLKEAEMLRVQAEMLLDLAEKKLKEHTFSKRAKRAIKKCISMS